MVLKDKPGESAGQGKVEIPLLDAVSAVCQDPTITDEEHLAAITCQSLPQVGMHCRFPFLLVPDCANLRILSWQ